MYRYALLMTTGWSGISKAVTSVYLVASLQIMMFSGSAAVGMLLRGID